jgi:hypothetical protein
MECIGEGLDAAKAKLNVCPQNLREAFATVPVQHGGIGMIP